MFKEQELRRVRLDLKMQLTHNEMIAERRERDANQAILANSDAEFINEDDREEALKKRRRELAAKSANRKAAKKNKKKSRSHVFDAELQVAEREHQKKLLEATGATTTSVLLDYLCSGLKFKFLFT